MLNNYPEKAFGMARWDHEKWRRYLYRRVQRWLFWRRLFGYGVIGFTPPKHKRSVK